MVVNQYDVVLVNLDPTVGSEIKKTRPCVIISPGEMNRQVNTVVVAPMTSTSKLYPSRVQVQSGERTGWVILDQIRTVDRQRIRKLLGKLAQKEIDEIKKIIRELYVD